MPLPRVTENPMMGQVLSYRDLYGAIPFRIFQRPPQPLLPTTVLAEVGKGHSQQAWLCPPSILLLSQHGFWCPIARISLEIQVGIIFRNKDIQSQLAETCSEKKNREWLHVFTKFTLESCNVEAKLLTHRLQCSSLLQRLTLPSK